MLVLLLWSLILPYVRILGVSLYILSKNGFRKSLPSLLSVTMNIFFLSLDPKLAAEYHCDKHVVKMILESAQLLYSAHHVLNPEGLPEGAYKKTHIKHPCSLWVRESLANYRWLVNLGWYLCKEYQFRYGETKTHKTEAHILWLRDHPPPSLLDVGFTLFRQAMPDEYKRDDAVEAYRVYYRENKVKIRNIVKYTRRPTPKFLIQE